MFDGYNGDLIGYEAWVNGLTSNQADTTSSHAEHLQAPLRPAQATYMI